MSTEASPETPVDTSTDGEMPETLADALGENGPGIAEEIESELSSEPDSAAAAPAAMPVLETDPSIAERLGLLSELQVVVTARLCETKQPLGDILSMSPGDVLDLGRNTGAPIELLANGVLIAYGEVVAVGNSLGVRVTKLANERP